MRPVVVVSFFGFVLRHRNGGQKWREPGGPWSGWGGQDVLAVGNAFCHGSWLRFGVMGRAGLPTTEMVVGVNYLLVLRFLFVS